MRVDGGGLLLFTRYFSAFGFLTGFQAVVCKLLLIGSSFFVRLFVCLLRCHEAMPLSSLAFDGEFAFVSRPIFAAGAMRHRARVLHSDTLVVL